MKKTTSLRIFGALLGLGMLCLNSPRVRADDATNNGVSQAQEDNDAYLNAIAEHARQVLADTQAITWPYGEADGPYQYTKPVATPKPQAPVAPPKPVAPVAKPAPVVAQLPPKVVPAFQLQIFNGATPTNATYYRDASGQIRFTSFSVNGR